MAVSQAQLTQIYLAYFGRPPDFDGLVFYTTKPDLTIWDVAAAFSESPESVALYGPTFNVAQINAIYQNLFNRDAEPAGLLYWSQQVALGNLTPGGVALAILLGAQNEDAITVQNKLAVSAAFVAALDTAPEIIGYSGTDAAASARAFLHTVDWTAGSVTTAMAGLDAAVAAAVGAGGTIGQSFSLTSSVDVITINDATTINTISGVVDGTTSANSTFSVGDTITGNNKTILNLAVADDGAAAFTTVKNVKEVNLIAGASGTLDLNAVNWSGIGSVNLTNGVNGLNVWVDQLHAGAGISVGSVAGQVSADYTNDVWARVQSDNGSSIGFVNNTVTGSVDAGGSASFSMSAMADNVALTVGDISITGSAGAQAGVWIENDEAKGGNITLGNVAVSGAKQVWLTVENTGHTASATAVNTTVGNVTLASTVTAGTLTLDISNTSSGAVGNLTVGNVALSVAKDGTGEVDLYNYGSKTVGNLAMGSMTALLGVNATLDLEITNSGYSSGANSVTVGSMTLGDVNFSLAQDSTAYYEVDQYAYAGGTGNATAGSFVMGNVNATLGQNASLTMSISAPSAYSVGGNATVGNVTLGNRTFNVAVDADLDWDAYLGYAYAQDVTKVATVGNVTMGDLTATVGINASADIWESVYAYGKNTSSIGNITQGNIHLHADDGGDIDYTLTVESYGKLGNVNLGSLTIGTGVSASVSASWDVSAETSIGDISVGSTSITAGVSGLVYVTRDFSADTGSIGAVTIGDLTVTAGVDATVYSYFTLSADQNIGNVSIGNISLTGAKGAYIYASNDISASNGAVGNVTVGNISVSAAQDGTVTYELDLSGETAIGNVSIGNVSISAVGANAYGEVYIDIENDFDGSIGTTTVGTVTMNANGQGAGADFSITVSSADTIGTLTVGNLDLSVGQSVAKATGAYLDVDIGNSDGTAASNVVVGDINLTGTSVRGVGDTTMTYTADVSIWSSLSTVTVGNITVSGGDGAADNFATLTNWLSLGGTTNTIGNVDYSGYGAAATIDVSGWKGAGGIVGTAKGDTITDNSGVNTIVGGAGADTFVFVTTNTGKTLTTIDNILDFNNLAGDKIDVGVALVVAEYGEAVYADFAAFLVGAEAANKDVFVGQVGGDSYVAVDKDAGNAVDYVIKLTGVTLADIDLASFV